MGPESGFIRAAFPRRDGGVEVKEIRRPALEEGSILVEMEASGICGTDLEKLTGRNITSSILGHEVAGVVSESMTEAFTKGDRVVPHHHVPCGNCYYCTIGAETMCESYKESNFVPCGFADLFKVPAYNVEHGGVHAMGSALTFKEASFIEPLGCCIRGLRRAISANPTRKQELKNALIVGAGPIGLLHMELLRQQIPGIRLFACDVSRTRLDFAEKFEGVSPIGVSANTKATGDTDTSLVTNALRYTDGREFDLVIVATGSPEAFSQAVPCVRKSGALLLFGAPHKGATHTLDLASMFLNELTLTASYATTDVEMDEASDMLERRQIEVKKFITATYPLGSIEEAMTRARSENQVKVIITR